jgi:hypothetical protein
MRAVAGKRVGAVAVALLLLLSCASAATAAEKPKRFPLIGGFELPAGKGYTVTVFVAGKVALIQAHAGRVSAEYAVAGRRAKGRFAARFGRLGRLALEFEPASRRARCAFEQRGTYRGTIRFRGERGYTEVEASLARGSGLLVPPADCLASAAAAPRSPTLTTHLHAIAARGDGAISLSVLGLAGFGRHFLIGSREERRGKMTIARHAFTPIGGGNAFVSSGPGKHPAFACLKPPKPFAGSAVFEETGESAASWTGNLSAWLPGAGRVRLAGPRFSSSLCRRTVAEGGCSLDPTVRRPLSTLQGSGSQSQLLAEAKLSWSRYLRNSASSAGSTP